ncbi:hypothetical protein [Nostoc sp. LPT]|nr:hypothetical protein [Nostoc sp. LPT]
MFVTFDTNLTLAKRWLILKGEQKCQEITIPNKRHLNNQISLYE